MGSFPFGATRRYSTSPLHPHVPGDESKPFILFGQWAPIYLSYFIVFVFVILKYDMLQSILMDLNWVAPISFPAALRNSIHHWLKMFQSSTEIHQPWQFGQHVSYCSDLDEYSIDARCGCTLCVQRRPFVPMLILPRMLAESKANGAHPDLRLMNALTLGIHLEPAGV